MEISIQVVFLRPFEAEGWGKADGIPGSGRDNC